jgi:hypothetical protein
MKQTKQISALERSELPPPEAHNSHGPNASDSAPGPVGVAKTIENTAMSVYRDWIEDDPTILEVIERLGYCAADYLGLTDADAARAVLKMIASEGGSETARLIEAEPLALMTLVALIVTDSNPDISPEDLATKTFKILPEIGDALDHHRENDTAEWICAIGGKLH